MSSSANRRPRVAGQRRRPAREGGPLDTSSSDLGAGDEGTGLDDLPVDGVDLDDDAAQDDAAAEDDAATTDGSDVDASSGARSLWLPAIALAVCLALLAAVLVVTRDDPGERPREAAAATATARSTLEQALSYNYATMTQQVPVTQALLTGSFKKEFGDTMAKTIVPLAQKDKTVVKARVYEAGVMSQTADSVTIQAFVNQAKTSDTQKEPSIDQNRVIATMTKVGNRWLVSALKAY